MPTHQLTAMLEVAYQSFWDIRVAFEVFAVDFKICEVVLHRLETSD